jgi:antitoxin (DNA-binding transcriptional repressor) of toxin-antitoxin stability system
MCFGASEGASGSSPWLGSGPRHIRAIRHVKRKEYLLDQLGQLDYTRFMKTLPLAEVKTNFSSLLKEVQACNEIAVSYGKKRETIAVIVPYKEYKRSKKRKLGSLKGKMKVIFENDFSITDADFIQS